MIEMRGDETQPRSIGGAVQSAEHLQCGARLTVRAGRQQVFLVRFDGQPREQCLAIAASAEWHGLGEKRAHPSEHRQFRRQVASAESLRAHVHFLQRDNVRIQRADDACHAIQVVRAVRIASPEHVVGYDAQLALGAVGFRQQACDGLQILSQRPRPVGGDGLHTRRSEAARSGGVVHRPDEQLQTSSLHLRGEGGVYWPCRIKIQPVELRVLRLCDQRREFRCFAGFLVHFPAGEKIMLQRGQFLFRCL